MLQESRRRTAGPLITARSHGIRVEIEKHCLDKMHGWCNAAKTEVSGWGKVKLVDGVFRVSQVYFPQQKCSTGYTLIEGESTARLKELMYQKTDGKPLEERLAFWDDMRFWWHTHYNFGTFWSGTDDDQAQEVAVNSGEWSLSLVINQAGDRLCRADFIKPIPVMVDKLNIVEVPNTSRPSKRNYAWDIKRWVGPMDVPKITFPKFSWKDKVSIVKPTMHETKFINYGGKLMSLEQYACALECLCLDGTCIDCRETRKELNDATI